MVNGPTSACGPRKLAEDAIEVGGECSGRLGHEEDDRHGVQTLTVNTTAVEVFKRVNTAPREVLTSRP